jgi:DNA-binding MarR family transcriptional regulator
MNLALRLGAAGIMMWRQAVGCYKYLLKQVHWAVYMGDGGDVKKGVYGLSVLEGAAWAGFLRAHLHLTRRLDADLQAAHGMSLSSYEVLLHLSWSPRQRMRMAELAESVLLSPSGISRLVDRLERDGLVARQASAEDRRGSYTVLTEEGLCRWREAHGTHIAGVRKYFLAHFTEAELRSLGRSWERVVGDLCAAPTGEMGTGEP